MTLYLSESNSNMQQVGDHQRMIGRGLGVPVAAPLVASQCAPMVIDIIKESVERCARRLVG